MQLMYTFPFLLRTQSVSLILLLGYNFFHDCRSIVARSQTDFILIRTWVT